MAPPKTWDAIVVGGGVAGLAAAGALARRFDVVLLEARERLGGRVLTERRKGWPVPVELGAEFVHEGNRSLWRLLRQHRLAARQVATMHWQLTDYGVAPAPDVAKRISRVTSRIDAARMRGWSFADFLRWKHVTLAAEDRALAMGFVEGFEPAPLDEMSAGAMAGETLDTHAQFALPGGYDRVVAALAAELPPQRVALERRTTVRTIRWRRGAVEIAATDGREFRARAAIVTLPLGVLQAKPPQRGAVRFDPPLREKAREIERMRMGHVVRLTLRIAQREWRRIVPSRLRNDGQDDGGFGFIHSRIDGMPVWWALSAAPVLTGWAGGPAALALVGRSACGIREKALRSLAHVLRVPKSALERAVADFATHNWSRDPLSRGAYSFVAAGCEDGAKRLRQPVGGTLFFAGEATADGAEIGTVHGALASGLRAADEVRAALRGAAR